MTRAMSASAVLRSTPIFRPAARPSANVARMSIVCLALASAVAGFATAGTQAANAAIANAGPELTHLLRAMALLKTLFTGAAVAATFWRLEAPGAWPRRGA